MKVRDLNLGSWFAVVTCRKMGCDVECSIYREVVCRGSELPDNGCRDSELLDSGCL